jgi:predicted permease
VNGGAEAEEVHSRLVSGNYFSVLGVSAVLGRTFSEDEDRTPGTSPVVVMSYDYWDQRFGRSPAVLGSTVKINGSPFTIIGVGPRGFQGEVVGSPADLWIPVSMQEQVNRGDPRLSDVNANWLLCIGRLKPGGSIARARSEITGIVQQTLIEFENAWYSPGKMKEIRSQNILVEPGGKGFSWIRTHDARLLYLLQAIVGLVLLISCINVANLLLARATTRRKEISIRIALGADRRRLIRQLLTESALLSFAAGALGLALAGSGSRLITRLASAASGPNAIPVDVNVRPDLAVLGFTITASFLTAILFGLLPALRATNVDPAPALRESGRTTGEGRWRTGRVLVVGQLALSVVLLIAAGLFLRSMIHLSTLDVGYSRDNLVLLSADLSGSGYAPAQRMPVVRRMLDAISAIPGVAGVTVSENGLFNGTDSDTDNVLAEGFVSTRKEDSHCSFDQTGPRYFSVIGAEILRGRDFDERDTAGSQPVAIINETMSKFYFGGENHVGRYITNGSDRFVIVGVARDARVRDLKGKPERRFYTPLYQTTDDIDKLNFEVRTVHSAASMVTTVQRRVRAFGPDLRIGGISPVNLLIDQSLTPERLIATLSGCFGILVLLLAANGLYGVVSYTTSQRTGEIGVRMAVGAGHGDIVWMVLQETLVLMGAGLVVGLLGAIAAGRVIASMLSGVSVTDPATIITVTGGMLLTGLLAGLIPAARASRIDPLAALRQE